MQFIVRPKIQRNKSPSSSGSKKKPSEASACHMLPLLPCLAYPVYKDGIDMFLQNVRPFPNCMTFQPRRLYFGKVRPMVVLLKRGL
jgi:hypothetical protein